MDERIIQLVSDEYVVYEFEIRNVHSTLILTPLARRNRLYDPTRNELPNAYLPSHLDADTDLFECDELIANARRLWQNYAHDEVIIERLEPELPLLHARVQRIVPVNNDHKRTKTEIQASVAALQCQVVAM